VITQATGFGASVVFVVSQCRLRACEGRSGVFDEERLRELGRADRLRLIRALVAMESLDPASDQAQRRRQAVGLAAVICCVILAAWIGVLAVTLPRYYTAGGGRGSGSTW
jgi:hypothetical protein